MWTIGWGHTRGVAAGLTCLQDQADAWEHEDIGWAAACVNESVKVQLTQPEFDALVDFVVNVGSEAFENSKLLTYVNDKEFSKATDELVKWDHAGTQVLQGLLNRRLAEVQEFDGAD